MGRDLRPCACTETIRAHLPNARYAIEDQGGCYLFAWATQHGRGVAMGNSPADVLDAAGEITGSVQDASLAQVLATLT